MKGRELLGGVLLGAIVGAALGLLLAPQSGEETREAVRERAREFGEKVKDNSRSLLEQGKNQFAGVMKRGGAKDDNEAASEE